MSAITLNQYLVQAKVPAQLQQLLTQKRKKHACQRDRPLSVGSG